MRPPDVVIVQKVTYLPSGGALQSAQAEAGRLPDFPMGVPLVKKYPPVGRAWIKRVEMSMDMNGNRRIPALRATVWAGLNDTELLGRCIPGCREIVRISDEEFTATVTAKVGPVKATFTGRVRLSDIEPPKSYTLTGEGQGGVAGFAKGGAEVTLEEDGEATVLRYTVQANVGGRLAQVGSRLIDATAKRLADQFFDNFSTEVGGPAMPPETGAASEDPARDGAEPVSKLWKRVFS